jgi:hypothetical protein
MMQPKLWPVSFDIPSGGETSSHHSGNPTGAKQDLRAQPPVAVDGTQQRLAPVQGEDRNEDGSAPSPRPRDGWVVKPGRISWSEHLEAFEAYAEQHGREQGPERMAERGGFSYYELLMFLGHQPKTWEPRKG